MKTEKLKIWTIMSLESSIKRINKLHYNVKSQSSDIKWYSEYNGTIWKKYGHNKGGLQKRRM